jgi:cobalt-zinc-cadmium efflux system protein
MSGHDHDHSHDDDHGHDHHHGPGHVHVHVKPGADPRGALAWALGLNGAFLVIEAGAGWWTGSLALLSDAAHMLSDVAALALALGAAQLARSRANARMTYGLGRSEVLGAFTNSLFLLLACAWIVWEAVSRLLGEPPHVPGWPVLVIGVIGLVINLGSAWALFRTDRNNLNVRGALAHMLGDALGSVGAIAAAGLLFLGWSAADAWISLGIAGLVTWSGYRVLKDSGRVLLELPPVGLDVASLRDALLELDGVEALHDLHVWSVDGNTAMLSAHLVSDRPDGEICDTAQTLLRERFGVVHATLQVESREVDCAQEDCGEGARAAG